MRSLESYSDADRAQGLADLLEVEGIESDVRPESDGHSVWVINDSDLEAASEIARRYGEAAPDPAARAEADRIRRQREADSRPVRIPGMTGGASLARGPAGQLTLGLIFVCVAVAVLSKLGDMHSPVIRGLTIVPISPDFYFYRELDWSQPWRLVTPMFIHFGILHLVFNMLWLYRLGSQIEHAQGVPVLAGLVLLTQVPGTLMQFELTGPMFGGMSGVVYGLFGYTWMQARYASNGYVLGAQDTLFIMGWFVLCATGLVGHIANAQHALGLAFGLLAGMPAYLAFRRSSASLQFAEGSWADLNIRGFDRFRRLYFEPYVPLWFLAVAAAVLWLE